MTFLDGLREKALCDNEKYAAYMSLFMTDMMELTSLQAACYQFSGDSKIDMAKDMANAGNDMWQVQVALIANWYRMQVDCVHKEGNVLSYTKLNIYEECSQAAAKYTLSKITENYQPYQMIKPQQAVVCSHTSLSCQKENREQRTGFEKCMSAAGWVNKTSIYKTESTFNYDEKKAAECGCDIRDYNWFRDVWAMMYYSISLASNHTEAAMRIMERQADPSCPADKKMHICEPCGKVGCKKPSATWEKKQRG